MNYLGSLGKMATQAAQKLKEDMIGTAGPQQPAEVKMTADKAADRAETDFYRDKVTTLEQQIRTMSDKEKQLALELDRLKAEHNEVFESYSQLDEEKNRTEVLLKKQIDELEQRLRLQPAPVADESGSLEQLKRQVEGIFTQQFEGMVLHVMQALEKLIDEEVGEPTGLVLPKPEIISKQNIDRIVAQLAANKGVDNEELRTEVSTLELTSKQSMAQQAKQYDEQMNSLRAELDRARNQTISVEETLLSYQAVIQDLQTKIGCLEGSNNGLSEALSELQRRLQIADEETSSMRCSFQEIEVDYQRRLDRESQASTQAMEMNHVLSTELQQVKAQLIAQNTTIQTQLAQLTTLSERRRQQAESRAKQLQQKIASAHNIISSLQQELTNTTQRLMLTQTEKENAEAASQARIQMLESSYVNIEAQFNSIIANREQLAKELQQTHQANQIMKMQQQRLSAQLKESYEMMIRKEQEGHADLDALASLESSLKNTADLLRESQEKNKVLEEANIRQERSIRELKECNVRLDEYISTSMRTFEDTARDVEHLLLCYEQEMEELRTAYLPFRHAPLVPNGSHVIPVQPETSEQLTVAREAVWSLRNDLNCRQSLIQYLSAKVRDLEENPRIVHMIELIKDQALQDECDRTKEQLAAVQQDIALHITTNQRLMAEAQQAHHQALERLGEQIEELQRELTTKSQNNETVARQLERSMSSEARLEELNNLQLAEIRRLQLQKGTTELELQTVQATLTNSNNRIFELDKALRDATASQMEEIMQLRQELCEVREEREAALAQAVAAHQDQKNKFLLRMRYMSDEIARLQNLLLQQQTNQQQHSAYQTHIARLEAQVNDLKQMVFDLEEDRARLSAEIQRNTESIVFEKRHLQDIINQLNEKYLLLSSHKLSLQNEKSQLEDRVNNMQLELRHEITHRRDLQEEREDLVRRLSDTGLVESLRNEVRQLEATVVELMNSNGTLDEKCQRAEHQLKELHKTNMKSSMEFKREIERLREENQRLVEQIGGLDSTYQQQMLVTGSRLSECEANLEQAKRYQSMMSQQLSNSHKQLQNTKVLLEQRTNELLRMDSNQAENESMKLELDAWKAIDLKFEQTFHRRLNLHNLGEITSKWGSARQKFAELEKQLNVAKAQSSAAKAELSAARLELTTIKGQAIANKSEIAATRGELASVMERTAQLMEQLRFKSDSLLRLNQELVASRKEGDDIRSQLEAAMQINSEGEEQRLVLERELETLKGNSQKLTDTLRKSLEQSQAKLKESLAKESTANVEAVRLEQAERQKKLLQAKQQEYEVALGKAKQEAVDIENVLRRQMRSKQGEVEKLLQELQKYQTELSKLRLSSEEERGSSRIEISKLKGLQEEQLKKLSAKLAQTQANCNKLSISMAQKDSAINQKCQELTVKQNQLSELAREKQSLASKLEAFQSDFGRYQDLQMHCNELNQKLMTKDEEIKKTLDKMNSLSSTILTLEEGIEVNQHFAEEKAQENERLQELNQSVTDELASTKRECQRLSKELALRQKFIQGMAATSEPGLRSAASKASNNRSNSHDSIELVGIKNMFMKYFDFSASVSDRMRTLDTLCQALQINEKEREHLQLYRRRLAQKEALVDHKDDKSRQERPIRQKLFSYLGAEEE